MSSVAGQLFNAQIFPILIQSVNEGIHRENVDDATRKLCSLQFIYNIECQRNLVSMMCDHALTASKSDL